MDRLGGRAPLPLPPPPAVAAWPPTWSPPAPSVVIELFGGLGMGEESREPADEKLELEPEAFEDMELVRILIRK